MFFVAFTLIFTGLFFLWISRNRRYESSKSVAKAYDKWTQDQLLETLWGEHVHLGYYDAAPKQKDFRLAKVDFVHELVRWSGFDKLPKGARILDVGCGIGGSSRLLAEVYGFDVIGISISALQVKRASELTPKGLKCSFQRMDALSLDFDDDCFDGVWSVEVGPHIQDKQLYADELLRVLRPGGSLAVADWNSRDSKLIEPSLLERFIMRQLLDQWAHPEFASISGFSQNLTQSRFLKGFVETDDWTVSTLPSWIDSILEGFRRPLSVLRFGPIGVLKAFREIPTILLMHWAFANGLMQFGVFRIRE